MYIYTERERKESETERERLTWLTSIFLATFLIYCLVTYVERGFVPDERHILIALTCLMFALLHYAMIRLLRCWLLYAVKAGHGTVV